MNVDFESEEQTAAVSAAKNLIDVGADYEIVLGFLRERGFNKLDSIKALICITGMSLGHAKNFVHHSRAWQDLFASDQEFHASLLEAVRALGLESAR